MAEPDPVLPKTIGDWTRSLSPDVVTAENIFDYMNGAGELYLGYRFYRCDVYEYKSPTQKNILVEMYIMESSDDAFGLLSLDWGGEIVDGSAWPSALYGEGLLRLWTDNIYTRIMATQETPESREAVLSIGQAVAEGRKNPPAPEIVRKLPDSPMTSWDLRRDRTSFFRTHLVLNSLYYLSHQNILDLDLNSQGVYALYEKRETREKKSRIHMLRVEYKDKKSAGEALARFHEAYLPEHPFPPDTSAPGEIAGVFSVEDGWMAYACREDCIVLAFQCPDRKTARAITERRDPE